MLRTERQERQKYGPWRGKVDGTQRPPPSTLAPSWLHAMLWAPGGWALLNSLRGADSWLGPHQLYIGATW